MAGASRPRGDPSIAPLYAKADAHVDTAGHTPEESFKTLLETLAS